LNGKATGENEMRRGEKKKEEKEKKEKDAPFQCLELILKHSFRRAQVKSRWVNKNNKNNR